MALKPAEGLTIELPKGTPAEDVEALKQALLAVDTVVGAEREEATRAFDAQTIALWVQIATGILTAAGSAVPLVSKIVDIVHRKRLSGVVITIGETKLDLNEVSAEDVERIIHATKAGGKPSE